MQAAIDYSASQTSFSLIPDLCSLSRAQRILLFSDGPLLLLAAVRHSRVPERARIDREPISCHASIRGHFVPPSPLLPNTIHIIQPLHRYFARSLISFVLRVQTIAASVTASCLLFSGNSSVHLIACRDTPHSTNGSA